MKDMQIVEENINQIKTVMSSDSFRAAYALNMCTVSVSQIIDYADINILEQEYDAILNNLNLELIPKDEALLNILKQLLDTITFFKMSEGDKQLIEQEYQFKMKNAIWSAVPNFGMIIAGGVSPAAIALSLASQVGIGYMNYRKNKAAYQLEKDKEYWTLQRAAIEQFNALRRELFTTAWRLADSYNFPDNYRLTESQIKQYNNILTDEDALRRFERLEYVRNNFFAYPPYWYYLGHSANEVSMDERYSFETREHYKKVARVCFETCFSFRDIDILRKDELMASCALEYVDLLNAKDENGKISELLGFAKNAGGSSNDVLQICAFSYLKINNYEEAGKLFRFLTNEQYNTVLNAQLLSQLYVDEFIKSRSGEVRRKYETLSYRINSRYLMPLPDTTNVSQNELAEKFLTEQRECLKKGFENLCRALYQKYVIKLNKLIPCPNSETPDDYYYSNEKRALEMRRSLMQDYLDHSNKISNAFKNKLRGTEIQYELISILNELLDSIKLETALFDSDDICNIVSGANEVLFKNKELINHVQEDTKEGQLTANNYNKLEPLFEEIIKNSIIKYVLGHGRRIIANFDSMADMASTEACLARVCDREQISTNVLTVNGFASSIENTTLLPMQTFNMGVFGKDAVVNQHLVDLRIAVVKAVKDNLPKLLAELDRKSKAKPEVFINGSDAFNQYVTSGRDHELFEEVKSKIAAFIVDNYSHYDLIITGVGVYVKNSGRFGGVEMSTLIPFEKIEQKDEKTLLLDGQKYQNPVLNINGFMAMVEQIKASL